MLRPRPEWIGSLPDRAMDFYGELMCRDHFGLFPIAPDSTVPWDLQSSAKALANVVRMGRLAELPGCSESAVADTVSLVQGLQDPETGFFHDPNVEPLAASKGDGALEQMRRGNTKWGAHVLGSLGAEPLHPCSVGGVGGRPDPDGALRLIQEGDWDHPWDIGSRAAGRMRELFWAVCKGHEELIPAVEEGMTLVLAHQNPETGMWGRSEIPLYQQISGALKVIGQWYFSLGFSFPHRKELADSCLRHHRDEGFYAGSSSHCIPRNVAEMAEVCLLESDYRRDELLDLLVELAERYHASQSAPGGRYAAEPGGRWAAGWNGYPTCPFSQTPRGDVPGFNGALWCLGLIADVLEWDVDGLHNPHAGWRDRVTALPYRPEVDAQGRVRVVPNG